MDDTPITTREAHRQPRRWARWLAVGATLIVLLALVFLNLDGYQNEPFGGGDFFAEPPAITWTHGWPWICVIRDSIFPLSGVYESPNRFTGPTGVHSRWPFDGARVPHVWIGHLLLDVICCVLLLLGTDYATARLVEWGRMGHKFGLRVLFAAITLVAISFATLPWASIREVIERALTEPMLPAIRMRIFVQLAATGVAALGTALTLFALCEISASVWRRCFAGRGFSGRPSPSADLPESAHVPRWG